jgi:L-ascorbate metabolism protein UlaG (beta-lactamase superfamily)
MMPPMLVTKYTHSCVRLELGEAVLVIDPGTWSEPHALDGCDAVLLTHEHSDHVDVLRLAGLGAPVFAPAGADLPGLEVSSVQPGERFTAAGIPVLAVGGWHATVIPDAQSCVNLGYIVADQIYHPGDALHVPDQQVETLLVPMQASWLKTAEAIDFVRAVKPERAFGIHDAQINERGRGSINGWLAASAGYGYRWLSPGQQA